MMLNKRWFVESTGLEEAADKWNIKKLIFCIIVLFIAGFSGMRLLIPCCGGTVLQISIELPEYRKSAGNQRAYIASYCCSIRSESRYKKCRRNLRNHTFQTENGCSLYRTSRFRGQTCSSQARTDVSYRKRANPVPFSGRSLEYEKALPREGKVFQMK